MPKNNPPATTPINLKYNGNILTTVQFDHLPRVNEIITIANDGSHYTVQSVGYNVRKNAGGNGTCESIDIFLTL